MNLKIYNSLTKTKEDFIPLNGKTVNMYSCGVTVYDKCHIGHARSLYVFTVIKNYLEYLGYKVNFVRNITDVDDKIIAKAKNTKKSFDAVVKENIDFYHADLQKLGLPAANIAEPRATENIKEMVAYIQGLIEKKYAYEVGGDVYFSVRNFKNYGQLSGQSVDKMLEAVRIEQDDKKKDALDFALWKKAKEGEPFWPSPWGNGRPGWHIECSVMSQKYLKCDTLDIHAGGRDLIFPHHENEIAQAEALTEKPFAKYWIHHGLLKINGQKMAKSLGNFITVEDAVSQYNVDDLKFFFLSSHYGSEIDFTDSKMQDAHKALNRFKIFFAECRALKMTFNCQPDEEMIAKYRQALKDVLNDDFNTPKAMALMFDLLTDNYKHKNDPDYSTRTASLAFAFQEILKGVFGLSFSCEKKAERISDIEIEKLLQDRLNARASKNFKRSDEIRDVLKAKGIIVEDGKDGQRWRWM